MKKKVTHYILKLYNPNFKYVSMFSLQDELYLLYSPNQ